MFTPDQFRMSPDGVVMQTETSETGRVITVQPDGMLGASDVKTALTRAGQYAAGQIGMALVVQPDGSVLPAPKGTFVNLSNALIVDGTTSVPLAEQVGNIEAPFATGTQGVAATLPLTGALIMTPGDYSAEPTWVLQHSFLSIRNWAIGDALLSPTVLLPGIDALTNTSTLQVEGCTLTDTVIGGSMAFYGCASASAAADINSGGTVRAQHCKLYGVTAAHIQAESCELNDDLALTGESSLTDCTIPSAIDIATTGAVRIVVDGKTYAQFAKSGSTLSGGAYMVVDGAVGQCAASADLATGAFANIPNGSGVYVLSRGRVYWSVPVGSGDIAGTGNDWKSDPSTSSPTWLTQLAWYVDYAAGDDDATGGIGNPVKTTDEIQARWGSNPNFSAAGVVVVTIIIAPPTIQLIATRSNSLAGLQIVGVPTDDLTTTVATYVDKSDVANTGNRISATALADFTPYLNKRLLVNGDSVAWVAKINPGAAGVQYARTSGFYQDTGNLGYGSRTTPVALQVLVVQSLPSCLMLNVQMMGGTDNDIYGPNFVPAVFIKHLQVTKQTILRATVSGGSIQAYGCDFNDLDILPQSNTFITVGCRSTFDAIKSVPNQLSWGTLFPVGPNVLVKRYAVEAVGTAVCLEDSLWQGIYLQLGPGASAEVDDSQIFDSTANGVYLYEKASLFVMGGFSGSGNTLYGLYLIDTATLIYQGATLALTGTSGDVGVLGIGLFVWADVPLAFNCRSGTDTLGAGGTKAVVSKNMPADVNIQATFNTPAGVPGNRLSVPSATRANLGTATSQFVCNSDNAGDTSTFDWFWHSPSKGTGGIWQH